MQANATFNKTMEQVTHRVNVRLICDPNKLAMAVSRSTSRCAEIINTLVRVFQFVSLILLHKSLRMSGETVKCFGASG